MTIKSLLLGSAAALAVVSGANAADAIVASEPEPAEYVKVCDAFGTGYFYIPGTETCLKIGGKLRFDIGGGELLGLETVKATATTDGKYTWSTYSRAQLSFSTAADSDYGTLKTNAVIRFNNDNGTDKFDVNQANIELGGLLLGQTDSLFTTMTGYAGNVINDGSNVGYGPFDTQMIKYTFTSGNVTAAGAIEFDGTAGKDYVPNLVAGISYAGDVASFSSVIGFDESASASAIKARMDVKGGMLSGFVMAGYNTGKVKNHYAQWNGDWAIWSGVSANVSDSTSINTQISYDQAKDLEISANLAFKVAAGFTITPEIAYVRPGGGKSAWGGMIRFDRDF